MQVVRLPPHRKNILSESEGAFMRVARISLTSSCLTRIAVAACAISCLVQPAAAETFQFNMPAQSVSQALQNFSRQTGYRLLFPSRNLGNYRSQAVIGSLSAQDALSQILEGTPLRVASIKGRVIALSARDAREVRAAPVRVASTQMAVIAAAAPAANE
ncbi:MAG: STN domain-containing protein [Sphingobium sp.]